MTEIEVDRIVDAARRFITEHRQHLSTHIDYSETHERFPQIIAFEPAADMDLDNEDRLLACILFPTQRETDQLTIWSLLHTRRVALEQKYEGPDFGSAYTKTFKKNVEELCARLKPRLTDFQRSFLDIKLKSVADRF